MDTVVVFDDLRKLEDETQQLLEGTGWQVFHCETVLEFQATVKQLERIDVLYLDHDLGGVAFGEDTSRDGVRWMCDRVLSGELVVDYAIIVTLNPNGASWLKSEMDRAGIKWDQDPAGRNSGLWAPKGF